jgi:hypothetical protein
MTHWTHYCMNCGPDGDQGALTTVNAAGKCERCGSEAVARLDDSWRPDPTSEAAQLTLLKALHQDVVRQQAIHLAAIERRMGDLESALRAYRAMHKGKRRCQACVRADELLGTAEDSKP